MGIKPPIIIKNSSNKRRSYPPKWRLNMSMMFMIALLLISHILAISLGPKSSNFLNLYHQVQWSLMLAVATVNI